MTELVAKINDAQAFGKVAVLMGGESAEREISLKSGKQVLAGLKNMGIDAYAVDGRGEFLEILQRKRFDRVFNVLHGPGGEDGVVQGALDVIGMPYTGSGVLGSALCMDKHLSKQVWTAAGLPTPPSVVICEESSLPRVEREIGFPVFAKPVHEGSSIGMAKVDNAKQLAGAFQAAMEYDREVLFEKWIDGYEYTTCIVQDKALPIIRIETPREFYDYEAKYFSESTSYHCPCGLAEAEEHELAELSMRAFRAVRASGWGRVDFMLDGQRKPWLLEVNTQPGMTDHSLVPMAAKAVGIEFDQLAWLILEETVDATGN